MLSPSRTGTTGVGAGQIVTASVAYCQQPHEASGCGPYAMPGGEQRVRPTLQSRWAVPSRGSWVLLRARSRNSSQWRPMKLYCNPTILGSLSCGDDGERDPGVGREGVPRACPSRAGGRQRSRRRRGGASPGRRARGARSAGRVRNARATSVCRARNQPARCRRMVGQKGVERAGVAGAFGLGPFVQQFVDGGGHLVSSGSRSRDGIAAFSASRWSKSRQGRKLASVKSARSRPSKPARCRAAAGTGTAGGGQLDLVNSPVPRITTRVTSPAASMRLRWCVRLGPSTPTAAAIERCDRGVAGQRKSTSHVGSEPPRRSGRRRTSGSTSWRAGQRNTDRLLTGLGAIAK